MPVTSDIKSTRSALDIQGAARHFGALKVLDDVSLDILQGERRAILGSNGAGKTTLFNLVTGDLSPSAGKILLNGSDITSLPSHQRIQLGLRRTYQHALLFDRLTVGENLFIAVSSLRGGWQSFLPVISSNVNCEEVSLIAEQAGLVEILDIHVQDLSHGQKRQLEVGMALAGEPEVLLLDEPAAGLSPKERPFLVNLIQNLPTSITIILVEHDMDVAFSTCDKVTVLHNGKVIADGTKEQIRTNDLVNKVYLGSNSGG